MVVTGRHQVGNSRVLYSYVYNDSNHSLQHKGKGNNYKLIMTTTAIPYDNILRYVVQLWQDTLRPFALGISLSHSFTEFHV